MKISLNWLKQLVKTTLSGEELARRLTLAGLEVEGRAPFGAFSGVVVAEVRGKVPHPNAAKLTLVDVWDGREVTRVVCGAPNVPEPGARVLWARPGARLPSGIELQPKEVRGVVSPGMLCAEDELGLGSSHEGIIVLGPRDHLEPGDDVAAKLGLPDEIWEVNVTPNRPDCLGHAGLAREVAALTGAELTPPVASLALPAHKADAVVLLDDVEGCPRYTALVLDGVTVGPSPFAERVRLQSLGQRALSNVVDATNLALHETGQPLHAFDLERLGAHTIVVRRAREGERLTTLDGQDRALTPEDVVICDADRPVALAGVMGGANSEVGPSTKRVLLESAYFDPARVRRTAKRIGLHTEASHRFERGVDPAGVADASRRCAELIVRTAGGHAAGHLIDVYPHPIEPRTVELRLARTRALLGCDVPADEQAHILAALGLAVERTGDKLVTRVPPRRPDLTREVDLIEEIVRVRGYDSVGATLPRLDTVPAASIDRTAERMRDALTGLGFDEIITYAFISPDWARAVDFNGELDPVKLHNPLREDLSIMRTSLLAGLLDAFARNLARGVMDQRLFEVGEVFVWPKSDAPRREPDEERRVAGLLYGAREAWLKADERADFFDLKGAVEELLAGYDVEFDPGHESLRSALLHPHRRLAIKQHGELRGVLGELHPRAALHVDEVLRRAGRPALDGRPYLFELDLGALGPARLSTMQAPPRFPATTRDLSFFIDEHTSAAAIEREIERGRDPLCVGFSVVEVYREAGKVPAGKKGMLWSFTYRAPDRTLTDAEVQAMHDALRERLQQSLQIAPR